MGVVAGRLPSETEGDGSRPPGSVRTSDHRDHIDRIAQPRRTAPGSCVSPGTVGSVHDVVTSGGLVIGPVGAAM